MIALAYFRGHSSAHYHGGCPSVPPWLKTKGELMAVICYLVASQRRGVLMPFTLFLTAHFQPGLSDNQTRVVLYWLWMRVEKKRSRTKQRNLTSPVLWEGKISPLLPCNPPRSSTVHSGNCQTHSSSDPVGGESEEQSWPLAATECQGQKEPGVVITPSPPRAGRDFFQVLDNILSWFFSPCRQTCNRRIRSDLSAENPRLSFCAT